jgi:hypothetical protein
LARRAERDTDTDVSQERLALVERSMEVLNIASFCVVAVVQAGVWVWCVRVLLHPVWDMEAKAFVLYIILWTPVFLIFWMIVGAPTQLAMVSLFATPLIPTTLGKITYFVFSASLVGLCVYGNLHSVDFLFRENYLSFSVYVFLAAFFAAKVVPHHRLMIFFGLVNLVLSILYYRFRYDPTGTVKPLWAGKLG